MLNLRTRLASAEPVILRFSNSMDWFLSSWWVEGFVLAVCAFLSLVNSFRFQLPVGYSGLYLLMVEGILRNGFSLPVSVPFYGPGGTPFAYPALAFYIAAINTRLFGILPLDYARFAPPIFYILFLISFYFLVKQIVQRRDVALLAVILVISSNTLYEYHVTAAGLVRAPALLFATLSLLFAWTGLQAKEKRQTLIPILLGGFFFGLSIATHLTYAVFVGVSLFVFLLNQKQGEIRNCLIKAAGIILIGAVVSLPWWLTDLVRFGPTIFLSAVNSHANLNIMFKLTQPVRLLFYLLTLFYSWGTPTLIGLGLIGLCVQSLRRKFLLPGWFLAVFLLVGEGQRFLALVGAAAASDLLIFVLAQLKASPNYSNNQTRLWLLPIFSFLAITWFVFSSVVLVIAPQKPSLTADLIQAGNWLQHNTAENTSYLYISDNHDTAEWMPYFARRTPVIGHWGAEWKGGYEIQFSLFEQLRFCAIEDSYPCLQNIMENARLSPQYLILPVTKTNIRTNLTGSHAWRQVYSNQEYIVMEYQVIE